MTAYEERCVQIGSAWAFLLRAALRGQTRTQFEYQHCSPPRQELRRRPKNPSSPSPAFSARAGRLRCHAKGCPTKKDETPRLCSPAPRGKHK